jgi:hypothetical protein
MVTEAQRRNKANKDLSDVGKIYWQTLPIKEVSDILNKHGFDGSALDGIYTGQKGATHEKVGDKTWVKLEWYKMSSGKYEVNAYVS